MMLCLDCGNSRLKWALRDGAEWRASGALTHAEIPLLCERIPAGTVIRKVIGCNVAGPQLAAQIESALHAQVHWIVAEERRCGVRNGYELPAMLGADRWAALIGAHALHAGSALVVMAGTATTIDVLGEDGMHHGGLILPGITLMASSLAGGTAGLPLARGEYRALPRNTHDAIISGAVQATLGAIERMFDAFPATADKLCLLTGGAVGALLPHLAMPHRFAEHLVLEGIACLADPDAFDPA